MKLKTLELKGFKSFAEQTVIHFGEDVIGIVGPNGSGKSNIVDAIRWVLGEQSSKELRLDQMSSVIFNGTKSRKPSGVAQVSLTFENTKNLLPTEYNTVSISRLLYRSGESEYQLNGVTCRLKDITNLLMDTGIGSNSYAIIALAMVDDILADKDNARRRMFEQAAGVSKYKVRKRETLSKLESTSADLERVEDLLFEINNNLKSLEQQARRTKRYFELKDEYKQLSIQLAGIKIALNREQRKELTTRLQKEEDTYRQFEVEQRQLEAKLEAGRKANLDQEKSLSESQRELNDLVGRLRGMENDKKILEQRTSFVEQNRQKAIQQIEIAKKRIETFDREIGEYRESLSEEKRLEASLEQQLEQAGAVLNQIKQSHGELKADLDLVMQNQQRLERELFELEKQKAVNLNQAETLKYDIDRSVEDAKSRESESENLRAKIADLEKAANKQTKELEQMEAEEEQRRRQIEQGETQLDELNKRIQKTHRELDAKRNEHKLTKSMVESFEGFPESIRFLSQAKNWKTNASLLSDLIYVEMDYRVAIENFLEPYLNYYVVQNLEEAYSAVQLLNSAQKGKANFFLLDAFRDYVPEITGMPTGARAAFDLIQCEPLYRNLVGYLLDGVYLTESEEVAKSLADANLTLLAKSGRFIQKKFSLSGGSIGLFEGKKIGRKKNLEILETAIRRAETEEDRLSTEFYNLKSSIEMLKAQGSRHLIQQAQQALNRLMQEKVSLSARLDSFMIYLKDVSDKKRSAEARILELETMNQAIEKQLNDKLKQAEEARKQISNTDGSYRQAAEQLSQASADFNQKNIEFIRQQNKVSALQRELSFREKSLDETRAELKSNELSLGNSTEELARIHDEIELLQQKLLEAYQVRKVKEESLSASEQKFFKARGDIHLIEDQLRKLNKNLQDGQILINNIKDKLTDVKFQISTVTERIRIEFNTTLEQVAPESSQGDVSTIDEQELQMKVERLKSRLDNYGEINPMAVEAYDEMKSRHKTITTQRDDILKAKEDLLETIKEIEETATVQFLDAFGKVRLYFIDVFRSLFTADDAADLLLMNAENPLESGIEIVAKPKGKRPQTISQLSGGEKTLTATGLLFALYLLKPAPFCIFDEVDAPLDDANIEKFNRIIKKFSEESQFIIVTHNKMTMSAVDTIYGVFMQEQGISAVTQVDFRELTMQNNEVVLETV
jgi:chromosome segregation protein